MRKTSFKKRWPKLVIVLTIIAFFIPVSSLCAKEKKHGAKLIIVEKNGTVLKAELLAVKETKLILMESGSMSGVNKDISDIKSIEIVKKSKFFKGLGYGLLVGGGIGSLIGLLDSSGSNEWQILSPTEEILAGGLMFGIIGTSVGGIWGAIKGIDESINLEGRSPEEIKLILKKLSEKARFPEKLPESYLKLPSNSQKKIKKPIENQIRMEEEFVKRNKSRSLSRIHISLEPGYFNSQGINDFKGIFESMEFSDDESYSGIFGSGTTRYPSVGKNPIIYLNNVRIEYSITKGLTLGFFFSPLGRHRVDGRKSPNYTFSSDIYLLGEYRGNAYFLSFAYMPIPDAFLKKSSFKVGTAIGMNFVNLNFKTSEWRFSEGRGDKISFSKKGLAFAVFGEYDYFLSSHWSVGINIDYKYVPVKIKPFQLTAYYYSYGDYHNRIESSMLVNFPEHRVNFGGLGMGINFGFHL